MQSGKATDGRRSETTSPCQPSWLKVWSRGAFVGPSSMRRPVQVAEECCALAPVRSSESTPPSPRDEREQLLHGGNKMVLGSPELQLTPTDARLLHGVDVLRLRRVRGQRRGRCPVLVHHAQLLRSVGERLPSSPPPPARSASAAGRHASASPTCAATHFLPFRNHLNDLTRLTLNKCR